ncbi:Tetratricopeptide repeat containing protein [Spraguea lophii 42_110]|uniref:Tetratricopeptide repeat containing protein n=1 Tax=Spraguea lophii (strain 42_110) TaxID=1358809 RepID=S7W9C6_SPRLO|nr:Tetratricopeptide repeat containing protein [Spraguea lophii 42_110]
MGIMDISVLPIIYYNSELYSLALLAAETLYQPFDNYSPENTTNRKNGSLFEIKNIKCIHCNRKYNILNKNKNGSIFLDVDNNIYLCIIVLSLYKLNHLEKMINIIKTNSFLLKYHEIRIAYINTVVKKEKNENLTSFLEDESISIYDSIKINLKNGNGKNNDDEDSELSSRNFIYYLKLNRCSIEKAYKSKLLRHNEIKQEMICAFSLDLRNIECILTLKEFSIIEDEEIYNILLNIRCDENNDLIEFYKNMIFIPKRSFYSPYYGLLLMYSYYYSKDSINLFNLGVKMIEEYPESEISYFVLGNYYLIKNNYKEAKKAFFKSIEIHNNTNNSDTVNTRSYNNASSKYYMALGRAHSGMKECESAVQCYNIANKCKTSYNPLAHLAFEYHLMNNIEQAKLFYEQSIDVLEEMFNINFYIENEICNYFRSINYTRNNILIKYIDLLITSGKYDKALQFLKKIHITVDIDTDMYISILLLNVYAYIYKKDLEKAYYILTNGLTNISNGTNNTKLTTLVKTNISNGTNNIKLTTLVKQCWRYKVTLAYIYHLTGNIFEAVHNYNTALLLNGSKQILEDLLTHALNSETEIKIKDTKSKNTNTTFSTLIFKKNLSNGNLDTVIKYGFEIFDMIDVKNICELPIT